MGQLDDMRTIAKLAHLENTTIENTTMLLGDNREAFTIKTLNERYGDLYEAAGAADATACSRVGSW